MDRDPLGRSLSVTLSAAARTAIWALALLLAPAPTTMAAPPAPRSPYEVEPGSYRELARFTVTYAGSGTYRTVYHAEPLNEGGKPDVNDARDSSTQRWKLKYRQIVEIPTCDPVAGQADPCARFEGTSGASGATTVIGRVDHTHVDGLYKSLDATSRCTLRSTTPRGRRLTASIGLRYAPGSQTVSATAYNPVNDALNLLPEACREPVDGIDRLLASYFTPGFSFAPGYGPDRWFTSATTEIPVEVFRRAAAVTIPLRSTSAGRPPRKCAVREPTVERCRTGGSWTGVLTFTARP